MTDPARISQLQQAVSRGAKAQRVLDVVEPYFADSRAAHVEAWARESDPAKRDMWWYAVNAHDVLLRQMRADVASGEGAQDELKYLAEQGVTDAA